MKKRFFALIILFYGVLFGDSTFGQNSFQHLWNSSATSLRYFSTTVDQDDSLLVVGELLDTLPYGGIFFAKLGRDGMPGTIQVVDSMSPIPVAITALPDQQGYLIWYFKINSNAIFNLDYNGNPFRIDSIFANGSRLGLCAAPLISENNDRYILGNVFLSPWRRDAVVAKMNSAGNNIWGKCFITSGDSLLPETFVLNKSGQVVLALSKNQPSAKSIVALMDSSGNISWSNSYLFSGTANKIHHLVVDDDNNIYISSYSFLGGNLYTNIIKSDSLGNTLWGIKFRNSDGDDIKSFKLHEDKLFLFSQMLDSLPFHNWHSEVLVFDTAGSFITSLVLPDSTTQLSGGPATYVDPLSVLSDGSIYFSSNYVPANRFIPLLIKTDSAYHMNCEKTNTLIVDTITVSSSADSVYTNTVNIHSTTHTFSMLDYTTTWEDYCQLVNVFVPMANYELHVYPNPVTDMLRLETGGLQITSINIINIMGAQVYSASSNQEKTALDMHFLTPGMYFLMACSNSKIYFSKFIKQ